MNLNRAFAALLLAAALSSHALAVPAITNISPRGLQIGGPTTVTITGSDLSADIELVSEAKIASYKLKPGAKPNRIEIEISLDPATQPGLYCLRVANAGGISSPVIVGIDRLAQREFAANLDKLPVALTGAVGGAQVLQAKLSGHKGQRLIIDVEAQRLGSGLRPVIRLNDARGTQIAWSPPRSIIGGDARIETELPADADYTIELHDELFRPTGTGFFRLKVGDVQFADLAFPLAASAGSKHLVKSVSSNIDAIAELNAVERRVPGETTIALPSAERLTGAAPRVAVSDFRELVETLQSDGKPQDLKAAPVGVSGTISELGEEDRYTLAVMPRQKLRFEVVARQFGSPLDSVLTIRKDDGSQVATGDDRPGSSDPLVDYTVPIGVTKLEIGLKDLLARGGREYVYRLIVRDQSRPEFSLSLATDKINIPAGGTQVIPVQVTRTTYTGPIELALENQPSEISLQGNVIAEGATIGLLTLSAQEVSPAAGLTRLIGRAADAKLPVFRAATFADFPGSRYQPRVISEVGLAITQPSPISLAWIAGDNDQLFLGGKMAARVKFTRTEPAKGKVRLKLLSSHPIPKKTVKQGMQDRVVDAPERTLRLEGDPTFVPDQTDVTVNVLVPGDLPKQPWDVVLVAELLSMDGKTVVTSLATPVRTLSPVAPFTLALTSESSAEGKAGAGETGKLAGTISRSPGYTQPIVVTLEGLPKDYLQPQVLVTAEKNEFELPLKFAFANKPAELKGVKLVGLAAPVIATSVKSNPIDVSIKVVQGEKPTTERPKEVFEEDEKFIAMLTEGDGRAIPDQRDQYTGTYALRVTPDQKYNAKLPNLNVKIRENPGPGEYRYVRFAWKKAQGNSICLQLAHDGKFGPASNSPKNNDSGREGAKFRYHAGPGEECFGASLQVADKIPAPGFVVVTRDLFIDFGEFTLTGLGFSPVDGQSALFDHIYLARQIEDFELLKKGK